MYRAISIAATNKNDHGYTMVSLLCKNKSLLSMGINSYKKTHPKQPQTRTYTLTTHAEVKAISRHIVKKKSISNNMTIYVVGITKSIEPNCCVSSHPCESCMSFIETQGIKRIVYATNDSFGLTFHEKLLEGNIWQGTEARTII